MKIKAGDLKIGDVLELRLKVSSLSKIFMGELLVISAGIDDLENYNGHIYVQDLRVGSDVTLDVEREVEAPEGWFYIGERTPMKAAWIEKKNGDFISEFGGTHTREVMMKLISHNGFTKAEYDENED